MSLDRDILSRASDKLQRREPEKRNAIKLMQSPRNKLIMKLVRLYS